jgi:hypothetical protein
MKIKYFTLSIILLTSASIASADEPLIENTELLSQEQAREIFQTQIDKDETPALLQAMHREQFRHTNMVQVQKIIEEAKQEGLPTKPLTDKVYEGIAKNIDEENIVQAITRVRNRYSHAYQQARELVVDPVQEELLGDLIAGAYTAGLEQEECETVMSALKTRTRTMNQSQAQELTIQTMTTARIMAHRDVRSETISDVLVTALGKSYEATEMKEMQNSFVNKARYGSAENVAQQFSDGINQGLRARELGHTSGRGDENDGNRGSNAGSGGAGSSGSNSSGNSGSSSGGSSGGSGSSGNSGGGSGGSSGSSGGSGNSGGSGGSSGNSGGSSGSSGGSSGGSGGGRGK